MSRGSTSKSAPEGKRLDLGDGQWVRMNPMTIKQFRIFLEADTRMPEAVDAVVEACAESHFNNRKPLEDQSMEIFTAIAGRWNVSEDEVALPPANGQPSVEPS